MHRIQKLAAIPLLGIALMGTQAVMAQDHPDNSHYVHHAEWKKGSHMKQEDWGRGDHIDNWKQYKLRQPPSGYEWRRVDGNFVLAGSSTGVVSMVVVAH
ncbi:RcnB family protein [Terracidiphilus sp.]|jgi:Ni/Co efflux regulator RcnB|uniref:RcnB family protein n=1 Tax=Terracidiphilus sp. TaxID=1964191 RepID=UPI003C180BA2